MLTSDGISPATYESLAYDTELRRNQLLIDMILMGATPQSLLAQGFDEMEVGIACSSASSSRSSSNSVTPSSSPQKAPARQPQPSTPSGANMSPMSTSPVNEVPDRASTPGTDDSGTVISVDAAATPPRSASPQERLAALQRALNVEQDESDRASVESFEVIPSPRRSLTLQFEQATQDDAEVAKSKRIMELVRFMQNGNHSFRYSFLIESNSPDQSRLLNQGEFRELIEAFVDEIPPAGQHQQQHYNTLDSIEKLIPCFNFVSQNPLLLECFQQSEPQLSSSGLCQKAGKILLEYFQAMNHNRYFFPGYPEPTGEHALDYQQMATALLDANAVFDYMKKPENQYLIGKYLQQEPPLEGSQLDQKLGALLYGFFESKVTGQKMRLTYGQTTFPEPNILTFSEIFSEVAESYEASLNPNTPRHALRL